MDEMEQVQSENTATEEAAAAAEETATAAEETATASAGDSGTQEKKKKKKTGYPFWKRLFVPYKYTSR